MRSRALAQPFRVPALEAVRQTLAAVPDLDRMGWAADAVTEVREPYRSLAAELLTRAFPALTDDAAVASTADLARRVVLRGIEEEKRELLRAIQRVAPESEEGRAVRLRLRELDHDRQVVAAES